MIQFSSLNSFCFSQLMTFTGSVTNFRVIVAFLLKRTEWSKSFRVEKFLIKHHLLLALCNVPHTVFNRAEITISSHYESGFYMTSFAATILIGSLATVGFLLVTLLIALTVMLQSCESKSSGVVGLSKSFEVYNKCKMLALHVEFNMLGADDFPSVCKDLAIWEIKAGQYARDLNLSLWMVESYFSSLTPPEDVLDMVLMDIDDILPSSRHSHSLFRYENPIHNDWVQEAKDLKRAAILRLYIKLQTRGWPIILLSRKPEKQQNTTIEYLVSVGIRSWNSLIMRDDEMQMDSGQYFNRQRVNILKQGLHINCIISTQIDATLGTFWGQRVFKLPNPMFYGYWHHTESTNDEK